MGRTADRQRVLWFRLPVHRDRVFVFSLVVGLTHASVWLAEHEYGASTAAVQFLGTTVGTILLLSLIIRTVQAFVGGLTGREG